MDESEEAHRLGASISASRAARWWIAGLQFWKRAPIRISLISLAPLVVEAIAQIVPGIGIPLSKLLVPLVTAAIYLALDEIDAGRPMSQRSIWAGLRRAGWRQLLLLSLLMMVIYVTQLAVATAVYGEAAVDVALLGNLEPHRELLDTNFVLTLVLPGMIPATLLMFALPLLVLGGLPATRACSVSIARLLTSPAAFIATVAITAALVAVAFTFGKGLLLLLVVPCATATGYVAYRDAFAEYASLLAPGT